MNERQMLQENEDFVCCPKLRNSIDEVQKRNPDGLKDKEIAVLLKIPLSKVKLLYASAVKKIKKHMKGA